MFQFFAIVYPHTVAQQCRASWTHGPRTVDFEAWNSLSESQWSLRTGVELSLGGIRVTTTSAVASIGSRTALLHRPMCDSRRTMLNTKCSCQRLCSEVPAYPSSALFSETSLDRSCLLGDPLRILLSLMCQSIFITTTRAIRIAIISLRCIP